MLRTTRHWLPRDLEVLKPVFERMRTQGSDFLDKNGLLPMKSDAHSVTSTELRVI